MNTEPENSYDRVLYSSHPSRLTHPDNLATLAVLFGLSPAPVECCRVLELGCGNGANLIPMAPTLPGSRFTGVDLAGAPIAAARTLTDELGWRRGPRVRRLVATVLSNLTKPQVGLTHKGVE